MAEQPKPPFPFIPTPTTTPGRSGQLQAVAPVQPLAPAATLAPIKPITPGQIKPRLGQPKTSPGKMKSPGPKLGFDPAQTVIKRLGTEAEMGGRLIVNAIPGMATFLGGLAADTKGLLWNKLMQGEEYDANTAQMVWNSLGSTAGLVYDAKPGRGWGARWGDYWQGLKEGTPITQLLLEDVGNVTIVGGALSKGASLGAKGLETGAAWNVASASRAGNVSRSAPKMYAAAERLSGVSKGIRTTMAPVNRAMMLPIKPWFWTAGQLGKLVRNGAYLGNGYLAWGEKAATVYRRKAGETFDKMKDVPRNSEEFSLLNEEYNTFRRKAERSERWSRGWKFRREASAVARSARDEAGRASRDIIEEAKRPLHKGETDPETGVTYGDLSITEQGAVLAALDGHAQLLSQLSKRLGIPIEELTLLSRYNAAEGKWMTPESAAMAADFLDGAPGMSRMQYDRLARAVENVAKSIASQTSEKIIGLGRKSPLSPHHLVPVPVVEYLRARLIAAGLDDIVEFMDRVDHVWELEVNDPDRIALLQSIVEILPDEIALDSQIYPSPMRPIVEAYLRIRRNLEREAIEGGTGEFPTSPKSGQPGAARRMADKAGRLADRIKERIDDLGNRIARLEEKHAKSVDDLRRLDIIEAHVTKNQPAQSLADEFNVPVQEINKILGNSRLVQSHRRMRRLYEEYLKIQARAQVLGVDDLTNRSILESEIAQLEVEARDAKAAYDLEVARLQQERAAVDETIEVLEEDMDGLTDEMFDAEDDYIDAGGDPEDLNGPDETLAELGIGPALDEANVDFLARALADDPQSLQEMEAVLQQKAYLEEQIAILENPTPEEISAAKGGRIAEASQEIVNLMDEAEQFLGAGPVNGQMRFYLTPVKGKPEWDWWYLLDGKTRKRWGMQYFHSESSIVLGKGGKAKRVNWVKGGIDGLTEPLNLSPDEWGAKFINWAERVDAARGRLKDARAEELTPAEYNAKNAELTQAYDELSNLIAEYGLNDDAIAATLRAREIVDGGGKLAPPSAESPTPRLAAPSKKPELPEGDAEAFLDRHDGWELYYSSEDLGGISEYEYFQELVDMKRTLLDSYQRFQAMKLAMEQPDQYPMPDIPEQYSGISIREVNTNLRQLGTDIADLEGQIRDMIRRASEVPVSQRLLPPELADNPRIVELQSRAAEIEKQIAEARESDNYFSGEGYARRKELDRELAVVRAEIETFTQPVSESDVVALREEYGGVPGGKWKRGNVEWYTRSEMAREGDGPGYYTPQNVPKGDIEPDRLYNWLLPDFLEDRPQDGLFVRIDKAPKGFVVGADPSITIAVPPTWSEFKSRLDEIISRIEGGRRGGLGREDFYRDRYIDGTNKEAAVLPEVKRLLKFVEKKIADGETVIYESGSPAAMPRLSPAPAVAPQTNPANLPASEIPNWHLSTSSSGFQKQAIEPYSVGKNKNLVGGVRFYPPGEPMSRYQARNSFGYDLMENSTINDAIAALEDVVKNLEKAVDRAENGNPSEFQLGGLWSQVPGEMFWSRYSYTTNTPEMLAQAKLVLDEAQGQLNFLRNAARGRKSAPARMPVPDDSIPNVDERKAVYENDVTRALFEKQVKALEDAQTAKEKLKALDDLLIAAERNKAAYQMFVDQFNRHKAKRLSILDIPNKISRLQGQLATQQERLATAEAIRAGILESEAFRTLEEMPANFPLTNALDPDVNYPSSMIPIDMGGGEFMSPIGPGYVPGGTRTRSYGGLPAYEVREGMEGWVDPASSKRRIGDRENIFNLSDLAARVAAEGENVVQNEAYRLVVAQHGRLPKDVMGEDLFNQMFDEASREAKNLASEEHYAMVGDIPPDDYIAGIGAGAPGTRNPAWLLEAATRMILGEKIANWMRSRGLEPVDPYRRLGYRFKAHNIGEETYFVPEYIPKAITRMTSILNPEQLRGLNLVAAQINKVFKTSTLAFSIMWQIGDITTAMILARMTGVDFGTMISQMKKVYQEEYGSVRSMYDPNFERADIGERGKLALSSPVQDVSVSTAETRFLRNLPPVIGKKPVLSRLGPPGRMVQGLAERSFKLNETLNRISRHAFFLEQLQRILKKNGTDLDTVIADGSWKNNREIRAAINEAAATANKWLGDFTDLTIAERRYVSLAFPFYAWTKHIHKVFYALGKDHPQSLAWYMYMGTLGSDVENDPLDLRLGTIPVFGGAASINFLNPIADVVEGPIGSLLLKGDPTKLGRATGPAVRLPAGLVGLDVARMDRLRRPAGTGMYTQTGLEQAGLLNPSDPASYSASLGYALQQFPVATRLMSLLPTGEIPGTNIATGPVLRYSTGEARTQGRSDVPVMQPGGQLAAAGRLFSFPFIPSRSDQQIADVYASAKIRLKSLEKLKKRAEQND